MEFDAIVAADFDSNDALDIVLLSGEMPILEAWSTTIGPQGSNTMSILFRSGPMFEPTQFVLAVRNYKS